VELKIYLCYNLIENNKGASIMNPTFRNKAKCISLFSLKGGVGKTTLITNLAGIYTQLDKKVLLLDMDLTSGSLSYVLNLEPTKSIYSVTYDMENRRFQSLKDYVLTYNDHIDVLAAPKDPRQANKVNSNYLEIVFEKAKLDYDIVLIDTNHVLNELNLLTLDYVDQVLFVMNNDAMDIKNMKSMINIFKDLEMFNYKILLNNSRDPYKNYFSLYDIKNIIQSNIDYIISNEFYMKNLEYFIMEGKIVSLDSKMAKVFSKDFSTFMVIASDLLEGV